MTTFSNTLEAQNLVPAGVSKSAMLITVLFSVASTTPIDRTLSIPEQLKSALSDYVARLEAVKLLRSSKRLGTIGARMLGAAMATGDVLVFMDAHCECHPGWLEPLLSRIADDR